MVRRVGFIGLGHMGQPMATNVLRGGFELMVYDLRPEPLEALRGLGARVATSPREVGEYAELVELAVATDQEVEDVVLGADGVLSGARVGTVVAIHSTINPATARHVGAAAAAQGIGVLDAQMSGGASGAEAGTLCFMVGGDRALFERCRPVFQAEGAHVFHMGELGMGAVTKIAQQVMTCITILAVGDGLQVAERAGVDLDAFEQLVRVSAGQSHIADHWREMLRRMDARTIELFYEGLRPALSVGHELGVPLPGTALAQQLIAQHLAPC